MRIGRSNLSKPGGILLLSLALLLLAIATLRVGEVLVAKYNKSDFVAHEAQADAIAQRIKDGEAIATPFKIGPYQIKEAGIRNNVVFLWTKTKPSGCSGFVQHPKGDGFNLWSCKKVTPNWAYISED